MTLELGEGVTGIAFTFVVCSSSRVGGWGGWVVTGHVLKPPPPGPRPEKRSPKGLFKEQCLSIDHLSIMFRLNTPQASLHQFV